jgi:SAM-dependent methyltransferase
MDVSSGRTVGRLKQGDSRDAGYSAAAMTADPPCPGCGSDQWREIEVHRYVRADLAGGAARLTAYESLRLRVLFELWFPDSAEVRLKVAMCERCGFVFYAPRPTEGDLSAKYRFLLTEEERSASDLETDIAADAERARRTFAAVARAAPRPRGVVLDYGGAEGRLLKPFQDGGWECELIDYVEDTLPGIRRLGATLADVPAGRRYDAIVCSHVLEHLAEPAVALRSLTEILTDGGVLFVEVPVDLWGGPPISRDPVTHINFLTPRTLEQLLARNGYRVLESGGITGSYAGVVKDVAVALATVGTGTAADGRAAVEEAEALLRPTVRRRLSRMWRHLAARRAFARRGRAS